DHGLGQRFDLILRVVKSEGRTAGSSDTVAREQRHDAMQWVPTPLRRGFSSGSVSIRAWAHAKLIRQIVLTVTWTELKSSNPASLVMLTAANQGQAPSSRSL